MKERHSHTGLWQGGVRDYECDSMGVVHHSNYSRYMDDARKEFLASLKFDLSSLSQKHLSFLVMKSDVIYCGSLKRNDQFSISTKMKRTSKNRFHFTQYIYRLPDRTLVTESTNIIHLVNTRSNRPEWHEKLEALLADYPPSDE